MRNGGSNQRRSLPEILKPEVYLSSRLGFSGEPVPTGLFGLRRCSLFSAGIVAGVLHRFTFEHRCALRDRAKAADFPSQVGGCLQRCFFTFNLLIFASG